MLPSHYKQANKQTANSNLNFRTFPETVIALIEKYSAIRKASSGS